MSQSQSGNERAQMHSRGDYLKALLGTGLFILFAIALRELLVVVI